MAARLRRELGIEVDTIPGRYGEYKVLVDGVTVVNGGALVALGMMPKAQKTIAAVRAKLGLPKR